MASQLEQALRSYTTPHLLEEYYQKASEYGQDALDIMADEIKKRGISADEIKPYLDALQEHEQVQVRSYGKDDFAALDNVFSQTDMLLVNAMLSDAGIVFVVDAPNASSVLPLDNEADRTYRIRVEKSQADKAHELIDEHFHKEDGSYRLKYNQGPQRLKLFGFSDVHLSEIQLEEEVEVTLSQLEAQPMAAMAKRLLSEADDVEKRQERVLFYYDNLEELIARLDSSPKAALRKIDLLTMIEVLQVYCDEPAFPPALHEVGAALLDFFGK